MMEETFDSKIDEIVKKIDEVSIFITEKLKKIAQQYTRRPDIITDLSLEAKNDLNIARTHLRRALSIQDLLGAKIKEADRLEKTYKKYLL